MYLDAFNPVIVNTIVARLAGLFLIGARGDIDDASGAAWEMLESYQPRTRDEMILAADIIGHSFHNFDLIGQAADPQMPLAKMTRVLSVAAAQHREACKSRRLLALAQRPEKSAEAKGQKAEDAVASANVPAAGPEAPGSDPALIEFSQDGLAQAIEAPDTQATRYPSAALVTPQSFGSPDQTVEQGAAAFNSIHRPAMNGAGPG